MITLHVEQKNSGSKIRKPNAFRRKNRKKIQVWMILLRSFTFSRVGSAGRGMWLNRAGAATAWLSDPDVWWMGDGTVVLLKHGGAFSG